VIDPTVFPTFRSAAQRRLGQIQPVGVDNQATIAAKPRFPLESV